LDLRTLEAVALPVPRRRSPKPGRMLR
jgi:hypothetical protein